MKAKKVSLSFREKFENAEREENASLIPGFFSGSPFMAHVFNVFHLQVGIIWVS